MSRLSPNDEQLKIRWDKICDLVGHLSFYENGSDRWRSLANDVRWDYLIKKKSDWHALMVAYYIRLSKTRPLDTQKHYYDQLLIELNELIDLLNQYT